jgi:hypothetical protein
MWKLCGILLSLDIILWSCAANTPNDPKATMQSVDIVAEELAPGFTDDIMTEWGIEAVQRFGPGVVVVGCHGSYAVDGIWLVYPTLLNGDNELDRPWSVQHLIAYEQMAHPGHTIVLLCCNVDHVAIHGYPGVWYSPTENFMVPTKFAPPAEQVRRQYADRGIVGSIDGFISAK